MNTEIVKIGDKKYELTDELVESLSWYILDELYETRREKLNLLLHNVINIISHSDSDTANWSSPTINAKLLNEALETNINNSLREVLKLYARRGWSSYTDEISDTVHYGMNWLLKVRLDISYMSSNYVSLYIEISSRITSGWVESNMMIKGVNDFLTFGGINPI